MLDPLDQDAASTTNTLYLESLYTQYQADPSKLDVPWHGLVTKILNDVGIIIYYVNIYIYVDRFSHLVCAFIFDEILGHIWKYAFTILYNFVSVCMFISS